MAKFLFVAGGSPIAGAEDEYNEWYEGVHLPAVLDVDGFVAATRYRAVPTQFSETPYAYLTMYEVEADSADDAHTRLMAAAKAGALGSSTASDRDRAGSWFFELTGPRRTS
jgi:hypothetical protein